MSTFFLILGIILVLGGIIFLFLSDGEIGGVGIIFGILIITLSIIIKYTPDRKEVQKTETIQTDSTQVKIPSDSIGEIQFIISSKDEDGVWCGKNVKLKGRTEKNIGDTIIVKIPK